MSLLSLSFSSVSGLVSWLFGLFALLSVMSKLVSSRSIISYLAKLFLVSSFCSESVR